MALTINTSNIRTLINTFSSLSRRYSSKSTDVNSKLVSLTVNDKSGVATITLQKPPVNSLNLELLSDLSASLTDVEKYKCKGLILTSSSNSVFSAGLDILEMYKPDLDRAKTFWTTLQDTWIKLYGSSYPTVAAINGHSPAGGCLLAMSCEYRIMCHNFTIGLNETQLGIVAPSWFIATMQNTISRRDTELAITLGRLFKTDEALKIGLIDETADSKEDALAKAELFIQKFAKIPSMARALTKISLRQHDIDHLIKNRQKDLDVFMGYLGQDKVQKGLEIYLEALKKKASSA